MGMGHIFPETSDGTWWRGEPLSLKLVILDSTFTASQYIEETGAKFTIIQYLQYVYEETITN